MGWRLLYGVGEDHTMPMSTPGRVAGKTDFREAGAPIAGMLQSAELCRDNQPIADRIGLT
jgi:hypothetical protein